VDNLDFDNENERLRRENLILQKTFEDIVKKREEREKEMKIMSEKKNEIEKLKKRKRRFN